MKIIKFNKWPFNLKLRLIFGVVLLSVFTVFLLLKIIPSGEVSYSFSQVKTNRLFSPKGAFKDFRPGARIDFQDKKFLKIVSEPVYFRVFAPRRFERANVRIEYEENLSEKTGIIELGMLQGNNSGGYNLKPIENKIIDSLESCWQEVGNETRIFQKDYFYKNELDFWQDFSQNNLANCSDGPFSCSVFYNYNLTRSYELDPNREIKNITINQALRGAHEFFVYFDSGYWFLNLSFRNLGLSGESEKIEIRVFQEDKLIKEFYVTDDSFVSSNDFFDNKKRQGRKISNLMIEDDSLSAALYKVEIRASDNIVIEEIKSSSDQLVFLNKIWPVYDKNNLSFFTDSSNLILKTFNSESLGLVSFSDKTFNLNKTHQNLFLENKESSDYVKELNLSNTDVLIELNGLISLNRENFFNPRARKMDRFFSLDDKFSYLITKYRSPEKKDNFKVANIEFDLGGANYDSGYYSFIVSVPGLNSENNSEEYLRIKKIEIKFKGKSLKEKLFNILSFIKKNERK